MGFKQSFRNRFNNSYKSHQIDDDYSTPRRSHSAINLQTSLNYNNNFNNNINNNNNNNYNHNQSRPMPSPHSLGNHSYSFSGLDMFYDPDEQAPSYESVVNTNPPQFNNLLFQNSRDNSIRPSISTSSTSSSNSSLQINTCPLPNTSKTFKLKLLGLKFLNAKQHFTLAICRDISLIPPLLGLIQSWKRVFLTQDPTTILTSARNSEHFLTGVWCLVSAYLSYSVLDGLIVRWIVTYSTSAAIVRVLSMSTMIVTVEQYLVSTFLAAGYKYGLHIWILISCILTVTYIIQNFITSNIDLKGNRRARFFDFYNIVVFAVVPVGLASFITMIGLLRSLLILRIDIEQLKHLSN